MSNVMKRKKFMLQHGLFNLLESKPGSFRVFEAPCECERRKLKGLLFYKWVQVGGEKKATRLIIHIVCWDCGTKSHMHVYDKGDYEGYNAKLWQDWRIPLKAFYNFTDNPVQRELPI